MKRALFSPEELAELAAFDAEIDAEPAYDPEEIRERRERDRVAKLDRMDNKKRRIAEAQRAYYQAHREEIAEAQRAYREANRGGDPAAAYLRQYRRAHGYSQDDLAEILGVCQQTISNWEHGIGLCGLAIRLKEAMK